MFGRRKKGGWNESLIGRINPRVGDGDRRVAINVESLTLEALKQSGFTDQETQGSLARTAAGYAAHLLLAQLRDAGALPDDDLRDDLIGSYGEMRTRMGLPNRDPDLELDDLIRQFDYDPRCFQPDSPDK